MAILQQTEDGLEKELEELKKPVLMKNNDLKVSRNKVLKISTEAKVVAKQHRVDKIRDRTQKLRHSIQDLRKCYSAAKSQLEATEHKSWKMSKLKDVLRKDAKGYAIKTSTLALSRIESAEVQETSFAV